jgi:hypothetical protein
MLTYSAVLLHDNVRQYTKGQETEKKGKENNFEKRIKQIWKV